MAPTSSFPCSRTFAKQRPRKRRRAWKSWVAEGCALVLLRLGQKFGDLLLHGALQRRGRLGVAGLLRPQPDTRSASASVGCSPEAGVAEGELRGGEGRGRRRTDLATTSSYSRWRDALVSSIIAAASSSAAFRRMSRSGGRQSAHAKHTRTAAAQTQPHPGVRWWSGRPASQRPVSPP